MTGISYFILHLLAIILPGSLIVKIMDFQLGRLVFTLASGYAFYVLMAALSKWQNFSLVHFSWLYAASFALLVLSAWLLRKRAALSFFSQASNQKTSKQASQSFILGAVLVAVVYLIYRYWVGAYDEIPADVYRHLEYARAQLIAIQEGHLGTEHSLTALLNQKGGIWYSYYALISWLTGLPLSITMPWATAANGVLFLLAVYGFAWYIFGQIHLSLFARLSASLLAAFFMAAHSGLNVFAYLRYYSLAPTMLNMVIYFAAIIAILEILMWRKPAIRYVIFVLFAVLAAAMVHKQEALFVAVMACLMLAWFAFYPRAMTSSIGITLPHKAWFYRLLLGLAVVGFLGMEIWAYTQLDRPAHFSNKVLQLSEDGAIASRILYLNPSFQGIQVITIWGLLVYALFVFYWRKFIGHPYLFMGMLLPLFTVFNPLFVDWFLRLDGVHTLWRMLYITPIHFVAALLVVTLFSALLRAALWKKGIAALSLVALFAFLLPLNGLNPNSRLTLAAVDQDESYVYWGGLIDYLNQAGIKTTSILTDPVTGYVLSGLTKHRSYQYKFFAADMRQFNFEHYDDAPLKQYQNWLLVLNDRGGGLSETGKFSKHWRETILDTKPFYSKALREHIKQNPENRFSLLWEKEGIYVYQIN